MADSSAASLSAAAAKRTPSDFLKDVVGKRVLVKLNNGTTYQGEHPEGEAARRAGALRARI